MSDSLRHAEGKLSILLARIYAEGGTIIIGDERSLAGRTAKPDICACAYFP